MRVVVSKHSSQLTSTSVTRGATLHPLRDPRNADPHASARAPLHLVDAASGQQGAIARLQLDDITVDFGRKIPAVEDVSIGICAGEFVALLGPSGCGKSTLLNVLAGFQAPSKGRAYLDGEPLTGPSAKCGVVFQKHSLFPWMTAIENVALRPAAAGVARPQRHRARPARQRRLS